MVALAPTRPREVVPSMATAAPPPQLKVNAPFAASLNAYPPLVTSAPDAATNMTLVNQSAPAGVPGGETLFMRNGGVAFAALKPSQVPGIFIVVHAGAVEAENPISSAANRATIHRPSASAKTLERPRRVIR